MFYGCLTYSLGYVMYAEDAQGNARDFWIFHRPNMAKNAEPTRLNNKQNNQRIMET